MGSLRRRVDVAVPASSTHDPPTQRGVGGERIRRLADMQVAAEDQVDARRGGRHKRVGAAADDVAAGGQRRERMVGDEHAQATVAGGREPALERVDVGAGDTAVRGRGARGVDAPHHEHVVDVRWRQVVVDHPAVAPKRREESADEVIQRHVVVAGHHQPRRGQLVEEAASSRELRSARALRQVAGDDDQMWPVARDGCRKGLDEGRLYTAEVQVREMDDRRHASRATPASATLAETIIERQRKRCWLASPHGSLAAREEGVAARWQQRSAPFVRHRREELVTMTQAHLQETRERQQGQRRPTDPRADQARDGGLVIVLWLFVLLIAEVEFLLWVMERASSR